MRATPYRYLDLLKFGSRPSKRPSEQIELSSLRAIPWVLCWTQVRLLLPNWWGVGSAWADCTDEQKRHLKSHLQESPLLSSFVKMLGFTLAKVELDIWELYFGDQKDPELIARVRKEFELAKTFVFEISGEKSLLWYRPWLEESIKLRAPQIHILNLLQIFALEENDEALLRETIVGIACGMLTTG